MSERKPEKKIVLSSIVAIAKNHAIGIDNGMIWHLPEDLKHFKRTTMGKPILMGRKSYESLGKPLPGRPNIVVSRSGKPLTEAKETTIFKDMEAVDLSLDDLPPPSKKTSADTPLADKTETTSQPAPYQTPIKTPSSDGPHYVNSIEAGIDLMRDMAQEMNVDEIFITGGGQIYTETLPYTDRLYITVLDRDYEAHVFFPKFDWDEWNIVSEEKHKADPANNRPSFTFFTLERE